MDLNFNQYVDKLSNEFEKYKEKQIPVESVSQYPTNTMPYEQKALLKEEATKWLDDTHIRYPQLRSLNLYMSSRFGYETIRVYLPTENKK
jgi:hypothetical protein